MPYLIIRTDVRNVPEQIAGRDGSATSATRRRPRRQTATADNFDAAMRMARALAACGQVRSGPPARQGDPRSAAPHGRHRRQT